MKVTQWLMSGIDKLLHPSLREAGVTKKAVARTMVGIAVLPLLGAALGWLLIERAEWATADIIANGLLVFTTLLALWMLRVKAYFRRTGAFLTASYMAAVTLMIVVDQTALSDITPWLIVFPLMGLLSGGLVIGLVALLFAVGVQLWVMTTYPVSIPALYEGSLEHFVFSQNQSVLIATVMVFVFGWLYHHVQDTAQILLRQKTGDLKRANQTLKNLSSIDGLTQLFNRHYLKENSVLAWNRCVEEKTPLTVVLMDIDHFKPYNDNYGHLEGDECLRQVSATIKGCVTRPTDFVVRYGGEEFMLVLPDTDLQGGEDVVNRIRAYLTKEAIPHAYSSAASFITFSAGVASLIPTGTDAEEGFKGVANKADKALYEAKENGRNAHVAYQLNA